MAKRKLYKELEAEILKLNADLDTEKKKSSTSLQNLKDWVNICEEKEGEIEAVNERLDDARQFIDSIKHAFLAHEASFCWEQGEKPEDSGIEQPYNIEMQQERPFMRKKSDPHSLFISWSLNSLRMLGDRLSSRSISAQDIAGGALSRPKVNRF